jgi:hypothetical protein
MTDDFRPREAEGRALADLCRGKRLILLGRHPRDTAVSFYFQLSKRTTQTERDVVGAPDDVAKMSLYEFVRDERFGVPKVIGFLNRWQQVAGTGPNRLLITYEEMRAQPEAVLRRVMAFIAGEYMDSAIVQAVEFASFENLKDFERKKLLHEQSPAPRRCERRRLVQGAARKSRRLSRLLHAGGDCRDRQDDGGSFVPELGSF